MGSERVFLDFLEGESCGDFGPFEDLEEFVDFALVIEFATDFKVFDFLVLLLLCAEFVLVRDADAAELVDFWFEGLDLARVETAFVGFLMKKHQT